MVVGAGIGLTPCASILCALTKYRWKKNFNPEILHFYWIVRHSEVESFQWFVHMLTELSYELRKSRALHQVEARYYCEINIYITGVNDTDTSETMTVKPMFRPSRPLAQDAATVGVDPPLFTAEELYTKMLNPVVDARGQVPYMRPGRHENRLQVRQNTLKCFPPSAPHSGDC